VFFPLCQIFDAGITSSLIHAVVSKILDSAMFQIAEASDLRVAQYYLEWVC